MKDQGGRYRQVWLFLYKQVDHNVTFIKKTWSQPKHTCNAQIMESLYDFLKFISWCLAECHGSPTIKYHHWKTVKEIAMYEIY